MRTRSGRYRDAVADYHEKLFDEGRQIFRHDTFGSEDFWSGKLRLHEAIAGERFGGTGHGLEPKDAGRTPLSTLRPSFSAVDDSLMKGAGNHLDGWPNRDLDVGSIVARRRPDHGRKSPAQLGSRQVRRRAESGRQGVRPDGKSAATVLPAAFGLAGVHLHTYTGWGSVTYWNAYVANTQMQGNGTFFNGKAACALRPALPSRIDRRGEKRPDRISQITLRST